MVYRGVIDVTGTSSEHCDSAPDKLQSCTPSRLPQPPLRHDVASGSVRMRGTLGESLALIQWRNVPSMTSLRRESHPLDHIHVTKIGRIFILIFMLQFHVIIALVMTFHITISSPSCRSPLA